MATVFGFHMCASESVRIQVMQKKSFQTMADTGMGRSNCPPPKKSLAPNLHLVYLWIKTFYRYPFYLFFKIVTLVKLVSITSEVRHDKYLN